MEDIKNHESFLKQEESLKKEVINTARKNIEAPPPEFRFNSTFLLEQKAMKEAEVGIDSIRAVLMNGWEAVVKAFKDLDRMDDLVKIITWFESNIENCTKAIQDPNLFSGKEEDDKASLESKIQLPEEFKDLIYEAVDYHSSKGNIDQAICALLLCITLNPTIYEFWIDYGTLLQEKEEYESALYAYTIANGINANDPYLYMKMANAWASLGIWDKAKGCLETGIEKSSTIESNQDLIDYSKQLNQWIEEQAVLKNSG